MTKLLMYYDIEWHSIKTCIEFKYIEQNYNSIDFKFNFVFKSNSSQVCMAYNGLHHFSMSPLFWFYQNNQLQKISFFFNIVHKIGWTPNIEGDKFWNIKSLACDVQKKELPNVAERSIQIKITLSTHIWSMITA
jgi:hypothetical protein